MPQYHRCGLPGGAQFGVARATGVEEDVDCLYRCAGFIGNSSTLVAPGMLAGHLTPRFQADGVVRELPALVCHEGRAYPSLALAALWRAAQPESTGTPATQPDWAWRKGQGLLEPAYVLTSPSLPGVQVPLDAAGNLRVPYRVARASVSYTHLDVYKGQGQCQHRTLPR